MRMVLWYQRAVDGRPSPCRFTPTCSSYALEALHVHGTGRGLWLTARRLVRCRPFGPSGWDPVPEPARSTTTSGPEASTSGPPPLHLTSPHGDGCSSEHRSIDETRSMRKRRHA